MAIALTKFIALLLLTALAWIFSPHTSEAASIFTRTNVALAGLAYSSVAWNDFNGDSKQDLLLTGADSSFNGVSAVMKNLSNGTFTNINTGLPGLSSSSVAWGDFDNDGKPDLLLTGLAGVDSNNFPVLVSQVWRNMGNGTFTKISAALPGVDTGAVAWSDFDNDGHLDILLTGYSSSGPVSQVWRNLGNGSFSNFNAGLTGVFYSSVARGDFDADGNVDILLAGTTNGFLSGAVAQVWRNRGNGRFTNLNAGLPGLSQGSVAVGDFDSDGKPDLLLTGYSSSGPLSQVWRNAGNGSFSNINAILPGVAQGSAAWGDFDNDGRLDILLTGTDGSSALSQVWRNTGNGSFSNFNASLTGVRSGSSTWGDYDNDGKLDILLTGLDSNNVPVLQFYRNNTSTRNMAAPRIFSGRRFGSDRIQFSFAGSIAFGYTVLASTNLASTNGWAALGPAQEATPGIFQFTDTMNHPVRFYRVGNP